MELFHIIGSFVDYPDGIGKFDSRGKRIGKHPRFVKLFEEGFQRLLRPIDADDLQSQSAFQQPERSHPVAESKSREEFDCVLVDEPVLNVEIGKPAVSERESENRRDKFGHAVGKVKLHPHSSVGVEYQFRLLPVEQFDAVQNR